MKEIIDGVLYDTSTAKHIGEWQSGPNSADQDYCILALYRKTNGEFFLTCRGGGKERYICHVSDGFAGRVKNILPLSPEDAAEWAEDFLTADEYVVAFGKVSEDDGYMSAYLLLPSEVAVKAQEAAAASGIEFSEYVKRLILADSQSA